LARIKHEGIMRVGFANEAPFGYATVDGKLTGEAPEVARVVLKTMGNIQLEGILTDFGALIPGLKANRFDMIAAGMFIRPARCQEILFSNPTYGLGQAFLVKPGNPKHVHSYADVASSKDAKLAVVAGGVENDYAKAAGIPTAQISVYPDIPTATAAVKSGQVDALGLTSLSIQSVVDKDSSVERATPFNDPIVNGATVRGYGAFGFRKEDADLRDAFNKVLKDFIGSREHLALIKQFGFTAQELPGNVTTDELCAGK
jgi:polar amino acid transport system substrate-binding protein